MAGIVESAAISAAIVITAGFAAGADLSGGLAGS